MRWDGGRPDLELEPEMGRQNMPREGRATVWTEEEVALALAGLALGKGLAGEKDTKNKAESEPKAQVINSTCEYSYTCAVIPNPCQNPIPRQVM